MKRSNKALDYFEKIIKLLKDRKLYPTISKISGPSAQPEIIINKKKYLTFSSNNYLGLANNKEIESTVIGAISKYGIGTASTRLLSGTLDIQTEFERKLAKFTNFEDSITFSSGYLANIGTIRMLIDSFPYYTKGYFPITFIDRKSVVFSDELNHASVVDAVRLSHAEIAIYRHNDMEHLEKLLKKDNHKYKLIITDGVFSMDGDLANLKIISNLAEQYDTMTYVDDSHGTGILGPHGEGTAHHLGVGKNIDVIMGSFTKAWGSIGGFVLTKTRNISDYLRITARSYIFSDPILPSTVAGLIKTLEIIRNGDELRKKTFENAKYLRENLKMMGYTVFGDLTPIVPPLLGSEEKTVEFSKRLFDAGILAPAIGRPVVKEGKERIRLSVTAIHTKNQIDYLLENMKTIGKSLRII